MLKRPKAKKEDEEMNEDDENAQKPVEVDQLVRRPNECIEIDNTCYELIDKFIKYMLSGLNHT